jgi:hypothetical protein
MVDRSPPDNARRYLRTKSSFAGCIHADSPSISYPPISRVAPRRPASACGSRMAPPST